VANNSLRGPQFLKSSSIFSNYVQHIFPRGGKNFTLLSYAPGHEQSYVISEYIALLCCKQTEFCLCVIAPYYSDSLLDQLQEQIVKISLTIFAYSYGYQIS